MVCHDSVSTESKGKTFLDKTHQASIYYVYTWVDSKLLGGVYVSTD